MQLNRDAILGIEDRKPVPLHIPEWGTDVFIRPMSGSERDSYEGEMVGKADRMNNIRARMAVRVVCDQDGKRLFSDADAEQLGTKSAAALDRIFMFAVKENHIGAGEVEAVGKSSPSDPSAASGSDSLGT